MNTRILGGNPNREKTTAAVAQPSIFYYRENILQHMCWCRLDQHAGTHLHSFTNLSWKGATTPWLVYQPLLEGSYDPLILFTSLTWKGATTPWLKATTLSTTLDHVSSIFTLDPTTSIEQHLQATFHHIFILDPFHTFKHNHISPTDTYQYRSDSRNTAEQIRYFIPLASANPSLHTRFPFTYVAYIRASVHTNQRIPQCIFHCAYALYLRRSCVYTRFLRGEVAYRSLIITEQHTSWDQTFTSDSTLYFRQKFA